MYARVLAENLMHCRECLLVLARNRKTLSSVDILINILLFGCLVLLTLTKKSTNYMRVIYG